jgi:hypothetical protein
VLAELLQKLWQQRRRRPAELSRSESGERRPLRVHLDHPRTAAGRDKRDRCCRVNQGTGADDDAYFGLLSGGECLAEGALVERLAEPDDVRAGEAATFDARRKGLRPRCINGGAVLRAPAASGAAIPEQRAVKLERERCMGITSSRCDEGGRCMQPINVLGDDRHAGARECQAGDREVRRVGCTAGDDLTTPAVPLPDQARVACERLRSREVLDTVVLPEAVLATKGRDAGFGADAGAGEDEDVARNW